MSQLHGVKSCSKRGCTWRKWTSTPTTGFPADTPWGPNDGCAIRHTNQRKPSEKKIGDCCLQSLPFSNHPSFPSSQQKICFHPDKKRAKGKTAVA
ncbi:hypothetical protein I7I50_12352 [Histoplasma capsulatum G186AR]|uniref:Uncharacterized protein n=1 Tax=Ajellomyces capsulatus TaxID=5037 RepID=A0A8H7YCW8_AJECA|nr:hypothetical protein I7I52_11335 [Histoplasma capsulatum]QSS70651.1 hypothetical protein I7I50_12352 [Histoplasma capsulatum G186AR]